MNTLTNFRRTIRLAAWLAVVAMCVVPGSSRAQEQPAPPAQPQAASPAEQQPAVVIKKESKLVLVDSVVTDKKGNYIRDLTQNDFKVFEDNKEQQVSTFTTGADAATQANGQRRGGFWRAQHAAGRAQSGEESPLQPWPENGGAVFRRLRVDTGKPIGADRYHRRLQQIECRGLRAGCPRSCGDRSRRERRQESPSRQDTSRFESCSHSKNFAAKNFRAKNFTANDFTAKVSTANDFTAPTLDTRGLSWHGHA